MSSQFKTISIQLVGFANDNPHLQVFLGTFHLKEDDGKFVPYVRVVDSGKIAENVVEFNLHADDSASLRVPQWCNGDGLSINFEPTRLDQFRFSTGIHSGWQSGMSGKLVHGGKEMFEILRAVTQI